MFFGKICFAFWSKMNTINNHFLSKYTSIKIGGKAAIYYKPKNLNDLIFFIKKNNPISKINWLGLGSNLLVRDKGLSGILIHSVNNIKKCILFNTIYIYGVKFSDIIYVQVGCTSSKLAKISNNRSSEFHYGIPGTVGGALNMNSGAFGFNTWRNVLALDLINIKGNIKHKNVNDFNFFYRKINNLKKNEWFIASYFKYNKTKVMRYDNKLLLNKRSINQPIGQKSCGSVFLNPKNFHVAKIIELCDLKGLVLGEAVISKKHSNFIINIKTASSLDVERLIRIIYLTVLKKLNIKLKLEIIILGNK